MPTILNDIQIAKVETDVPPILDISKVNDVNPQSHSAYITAKRETLTKAYETYVTSGLAGDLEIYNTWLTKFNAFETTTNSSLNLDRKSILRDYFLVANGYQEFCGDEYTTKMKDKGVTSIVNLNGVVGTMAGMDKNYFITGTTTVLDTLNTNVAPALVQAQEIATAKGLQLAMSGEIITAAMNRIWDEKKDFFTGYLGFANWVAT